MKSLLVILCILLNSNCFIYADSKLGEFRQWTSSSGKKLTAQLLRTDGEKISLKTTKGKVVRFTVSSLDKAEVSALSTWKRQNLSGLNVPSGPFNWPKLFRGKAGFNVNYVKFDEKKRFHLYETEYFDFYVDTKLSHSTVWKCSAIFYNAAGLLNALPIHLECLPDKDEERYQIYLVASRARYKALGGLPNSGGFYDPQKNITVIPFESLGIEKEGSSWEFDEEKFSYQTLIHELTHHLTYLRWPGQPCWLEEGMADFMGTMPYKGSEFTLIYPGRYIYDDLLQKFKRTEVEHLLIPGGKYQALPLEYVMQVPRRHWNALVVRDQLNGIRQYNTSLLLFYYFAYLDDKGDGANLIQFMHAQRKAFVEKKVAHQYDNKLREKYLLRGRSYKQLQREMQKALKEKKILVNFK